MRFTELLTLNPRTCTVRIRLRRAEGGSRARAEVCECGRGREWEQMWAMERDEEATALGVGATGRRAVGANRVGRRVASWRIVEENIVM